MTDDLGLGTALRERVADEHPDLDRLISVSTRTGTRLRRRRTAAMSAGAAVATVAVIGVVGSSLGGRGGAAGTDPGFATQPTPTASTLDDQQLAKELDRLAADAAKAQVAPPEAAPVSVDAPPWRCDEPGDEKFTCRKGVASVTVTWRPTRERADYLDAGKADVGNGLHTFVSDAHGEYFATVAPGQHATQAEVDRIGHALVWTS